VLESLDGMRQELKTEQSGKGEREPVVAQMVDVNASAQTIVYNTIEKHDSKLNMRSELEHYLQQDISREYCEEAKAPNQQRKLVKKSEASFQGRNSSQSKAYPSDRFKQASTRLTPQNIDIAQNLANNRKAVQQAQKWPFNNISSISPITKPTFKPKMRLQDRNKQNVTPNQAFNPISLFQMLTPLAQSRPSIQKDVSQRSANVLGSSHKKKKFHLEK